MHACPFWCYRPTFTRGRLLNSRWPRITSDFHAGLLANGSDAEGRSCRRRRQRGALWTPNGGSDGRPASQPAAARTPRNLRSISRSATSTAICRRTICRTAVAAVAASNVSRRSAANGNSGRNLVIMLENWTLFTYQLSPRVEQHDVAEKIGNFTTLPARICEYRLEILCMAGILKVLTAALNVLLVGFVTDSKNFTCTRFLMESWMTTAKLESQQSSRLCEWSHGFYLRVQPRIICWYKLKRVYVVIQKGKLFC